MSALALHVVGAIRDDQPMWSPLVALCSAAYDEDFAPILRVQEPEAHVLGLLDGELVAHACWVTRALAPGGLPPLRTAFVEAVATSERQRRRGFASAVLRRLAAAVADFELAALSPSRPAFYERLGWRLWQGPLAIRCHDGTLLPTPDDEVMILPLARTPALDPTGLLTAEWRTGELW